ncbi:MAG: 23S rRNA (pseudouridine(1915)-N(3))-methyltransferase RlmH [Pseudomonadota bacterium]
MEGRSGISRGARRLKLTLLAVGKAPAGPEAELTARYVQRAQKAGRAMGLTRVTVRELPDLEGPRRGDLEGANILAKRPPGLLVALDEAGIASTTADLARHLRQWSDLSQDVTFAIGGADGHTDVVRTAADKTLSLSPMTLPHLLARALLAEQIYRAVTLCIGHPYHRA